MTLNTTRKLSNNLLQRNTATTEIDPILQSAMRDKTYHNYAGYDRVNDGQIKQASFGKDFFHENILGFDNGDTTEAYSKTIGGFDPFSNKTDFEKIRKDTQSRTAAITNLAGQFVAKTAINTIGGIIGGFYGIGASIGEYATNEDATALQAASKLFDNSFVRATDKMTESVEKNASVFTSQTDQKNSAFGMFSGLETLKNVSDAMAFTAGAILSEVLTAGLASGAVAATNATKWTKMANNATRAFSTENKLGRAINKGGQTVDKFGKAMGYGEEGFGVGNKLAKIGRESDEVNAVLKGMQTTEGTEAFSRLAMTEGMGTEAMAKNMSLANTFKNATIGTRRVITGSLFEGSLEARQAKDSMMINLSQEVEDEMESQNMPKSKREAYKAARMKKGEELANRLGLAVTAVNVGLLSVSNAIQFPTIFGKKAYEVGKGMDRNAGVFVRSKVLGEGSEGMATEAVSHWSSKAANKAIRIVKNPLSEFMEETLQGVTSKAAQNYHERLSRASSHTEGLDTATGNFAEDLEAAFKDQYTTTAGLSEGMIGALVGLIGLPIMHKNSAGKWRPKMEGGVWADLKGISQEDRAERVAAMAALNPENMLGAVKYNIEQTKLNNSISREENKAGASMDNDRIEELKDDKIFSHVANYYDKGMSSYLAEEMEALEAMPVEEYLKRTRGEATEEKLTEEEKKEELDVLFGKMNAYTSAYEKVHKGMNMDKMNDNTFTDRLFKHLTYALANEKVSLEKYDALKEKLRAKGTLLSDTDLYDLAVGHSNFGGMSKEEIDAEIKSMNEDDKRHIFHGYSSQRGSTRKDLKGVSKELRASVRKTLSSIENDNDFDSVREKLDKIDNANVGEYTDDKIFMQNSSVYKQARAMLTDEAVTKSSEKRLAELESDRKDDNTNRLLDVAEAYQPKQSEVMDELIGKPKRLTRMDLDRYIELMQKHRENSSKAIGASSSFLDTLDNEQNEEANSTLNSMAKVARRREESLRAAAALYGLGNVSESLRKIAIAEFKSNIENVLYYKKVLQVLINSEDDTEDAGKTLAYNKLVYATDVLKKSMEEFDRMSPVEEGQEDPMEEIKQEINELIEEVGVMTDRFKIIIDGKDAINDAIDSSVNQILEQQKELKKIEAERAAEEEVIIGKEHDLINDSEIFSYDIKTATTVSVTDGFITNDKDGKSFKDKVLDGDIKHESITEMVPDFNAGDDKGFQDYLEKQGKGLLALYNEGKRQYEENKSLILNADAMQPAFDENGHFIIDGENSALQFFVATYRVNMNFTKGSYSKDYELGKKIAISSEDVVSTSYLFTPFFILDKKRAEKLKKEIEDRDALYQSKVDKIMKSGDSPANKDKAILALDNMKKENEAIKTKANDNSTYQLRKRMLIEMHANELAGESNDNYRLQMHNSFNYGQFKEHSELPNNYSNFLLAGNEGDNLGMDLIDGKTLPDGSKEDVIDELINKHSVVYVDASGQLVSFVDKSVSLDKTRHEKSTGQVYFIHETPSGQNVPVRLNRQTLGANPKILDDLAKYVKMGMENAGEFSNEIQDIPINIEQGEFLGLFDNNPSRPTTLKRLLQMFAAEKKDAGEDFTRGYLLSFKEKKAVELVPSGVEEEAKTLDQIKEMMNNAGLVESEADKKEAKEKKKAEYSINIGNLHLNKMDSVEMKMEQIKSALSGLRYYMNSSAFRIYEGEKSTFNKEAYKIMIKSGLITHGFNVKDNFDKIFDKNNAQGAKQNVKVVLVPIDSGMVSKAVMNRRKEKAKEAAVNKIPSGTALKKIFGVTNSEKQKVSFANFNEKIMRNQFMKKANVLLNAKLVVIIQSGKETISDTLKNQLIIDSTNEVADLLLKDLNELSMNKPNTYDHEAFMKFKDLLIAGENASGKAVDKYFKEVKDLVSQAIKKGNIVNVAMIVTELSRQEILKNDKLQELMIKASNDYSERFNFHDMIYGPGMKKSVANLAGAVTREDGANPVTTKEITAEFLAKVNAATKFFEEKINNHSIKKGNGNFVPDISIRKMNNKAVAAVGEHIEPKNINKENNSAESTSAEFKGLMTKPFSFKYVTQEIIDGEVKTRLKQATSMEEAMEKSGVNPETGNYDNIVMFANLAYTTPKTKPGTKDKNYQQQMPMFWGKNVNSLLVFKSKVVGSKDNATAKQFFSYAESMYFPGFDANLDPIIGDQRKITDHIAEITGRMNSMTTALEQGNSSIGKTISFAGLEKSINGFDEAMNAEAENMKIVDEQLNLLKVKTDDLSNKEINEIIQANGGKLDFDEKPRSLREQGLDKNKKTTVESKKETISLSDALSTLNGVTKEDLITFNASLKMEDDAAGMKEVIMEHLKDTYGKTEGIFAVAVRDTFDVAEGTLSSERTSEIINEISIALRGKPISEEDIIDILTSGTENCFS